MPPERLVRAQLLLALDTIRRERPLGDRIDTDRLFRWLLDLPPGAAAFGHAVVPHPRTRLGDGGPTRAFFDAVVADAFTAGLCGEPVRVDGTRIERVASAKSVQPIPVADAATDRGPSPAPPPPGNGFKPRNRGVDSHGQKRAMRRTNARPTRRRTSPARGRGRRRSVDRESDRVERGHSSDRTDRPGGADGGPGGGGRVGITAREGAEDAGADKGAEDAGADKGADKGADSGAFFSARGPRAIEPHGPRVPEPRAPAAVAYRKPRAGVEARQRMTGRAGGEGFRRSQTCRKKIEAVFGGLKGVGGPVGVDWWGGGNGSRRWNGRRQRTIGCDSGGRRRRVRAVPVWL